MLQRDSARILDPRKTAVDFSSGHSVFEFNVKNDVYFSVLIVSRYGIDTVFMLNIAGITSLKRMLD